MGGWCVRLVIFIGTTALVVCCGVGVLYGWCVAGLMCCGVNCRRVPNDR